MTGEEIGEMCVTTDGAGNDAGVAVETNKRGEVNGDADFDWSATEDSSVKAGICLDLGDRSIGPSDANLWSIIA